MTSNKPVSICALMEASLTCLVSTDRLEGSERVIADVAQEICINKGLTNHRLHRKVAKELRRTIREGRE